MIVDFRSSTLKFQGVADERYVSMNPSSSEAVEAEKLSPSVVEAGGAASTPWRRLVQFCTLVVRQFIANRCPVRASALAYSNLLAIVPVLAVVISVTSGLLKQDGQARIEQAIQEFVSMIIPETRHSFRLEDDPTLASARKELATGIQGFIQNTRSGTLGATGLVALLFVGIGMLVRIENTFNDIWGVTQGRTWVSRVVHYWAAMTLGPILLVAAIALTGSPHLQTTKDFLASLPLGAGQAITYCFRFLPVVILTATFTAFYQLMPHTKVDWRASLVEGLVGGTLWQLNNLLGVFYASQVISNSNIYGSLGIIPMVMIGLYFSWIILLFGAQVAYVFQNRQAYFQENRIETFSHTGRELVGIQVMTLAARAFRDGNCPPTLAQLAGTLNVPTRLITLIVRQLEQCRLLVEVSQGETGFAPGRPLETITCHDILSAMRLGNGRDPLVVQEELGPSLRRELARVRQAEREVSGSMTLADLTRLEIQS